MFDQCIIQNICSTVFLVSKTSQDMLLVLMIMNNFLPFQSHILLLIYKAICSLFCAGNSFFENRLSNQDISKDIVAKSTTQSATSSWSYNGLRIKATIYWAN